MSNYLKLGEPLPKKLQRIIQDNVRFNETAPYSYFVSLNKHIPHGELALHRKLEEIRKFAERNMGYLTVAGIPLAEIKDYELSRYTRISGSQREVKFEMNCACVAAKAFDALIPQ